MKAVTILRSDDEQRRLEECSREPIRTPGSVQPHGALVVVDSRTLVVRHASENCASILHIDASQLLGKTIDAATGEVWAREHRAVLLSPETSRNPIALTIAGRRFDVIIHHAGDSTIVEFERSLAAEDYQSTTAVYSVIHQLTKATTEHDLWESAARELRRLTLFDRVMIYHFHPDDHGEVVAEAVADDMDPFLGLHYPASDIPPQARALYLTKLSRMIASSTGEVSALLSDSTAENADPATLDLSQAELRSVSPHHLQFMRNMGQASTLSLSLVSGNELIGMITLAHRTPRRVPFELRQSLEILAAQVSVQLSAMTQIRRLTQQMQLRSIRAELINQITLSRSSRAVDVAGALFDRGLTVLDLIAASGAVIGLESHHSSVGATPALAAVLAAVELIDPATTGLFVAESLPEQRPDVARLLPGVTGMLVVPLAGGSGFIAWFRPEISETVSWLGDQTPSNRLTPLSPRTSFASWTQSVTGRSLPWAGLESEAEELARDLAAVMARQAEAELAALAMHDALTGLPNRRSLMDRLERRLAVDGRPAELSLLFIDVDAFKGVNDSLGHDAGDAVLVHVANQIRAATRTHDLVARLGGDEFVVVCDGATPEEAAEIASRIVDAIKQPTFAAGRIITVTASVGLAAAGEAVSASDLLRSADVAMYRAKAAGRDRSSS